MTAILSATLLLAMQTAGASAPSPSTSAPAPALSLEQQSGLRCAAAFALIARGQAAGDAGALTYPALGKRGREFFVRTAARLIDETGLDRDGVARLLSAEAGRLAQEEGALERTMPACLLLLESSGL
ncbi:hypothetical protein Q9K01_01825 [Qipengyuania sp. DY56-A-20]|jgi:hypothetical protein|uniref:Uncharacterized protein n=1 Tax=Qipengyuania benthica TaxID=3067651 RepID=A0ABT9H4X5_9SPHN|nr:hypothetical protein [Qipengyuania sp. DY56-A-20]MDP4538366.1 hypothetical protein [Qipengyuania sp. DY56-A-20]